MRLLAALLVLAPLSALAAPEDPGPDTATSETDTVQIGPSMVSVLLCEPMPLNGPAPLMAMATTVTESTSVLQGLCLQYASYGFVVAVPTLGFGDTQAQSIGATLLDTLSFLVSENSRSGSRYFGKLDVVHRGVLGFETGAMGAVAAAQADDTLSVAIALDPYDINGQARTLAEQIAKVPVTIAETDPDVCNGQDSFATVYEALPGPAMTLHVYDSFACSVENPQASDCTACGNAYRAYAANLFLRYATAFADYFVACNPAMRSYIDGAGIQGDETQVNIDTVMQQDLPSSCGPYVVPDAGPPDAGPTDGGTEKDAVPSNGCDCGSAGATGTSEWLLAAFVVLGGAARRRR